MAFSKSSQDNVGGDDGVGVWKGWRKRLRYFITHAPFAMVASSMPGLVNYVIILYLVHKSSEADAGLYRLYFSCFSLLGLASLFETSKVLVRSIVNNDTDSVVALFGSRVLFAVCAQALFCLGCVVGYLIWGDTRFLSVMLIGLIAVVYYPCDCYLPALQARQKFATLFCCEIAKYGTALAAFIILVANSFAVEVAVYGQFLVMLLFNLAYFVFMWRGNIARFLQVARYFAALKSAVAREARTLSLANVLPAALEHIDKLVIGFVFDLKTLGLYTLGFSTGRFLYNALKPALYIYYRSFVHKMPSRALLLNVGVAFTAFGMMLSLMFLLAVAYVPALAKFRGSELVTVILFVSYGLAMVDAIYVQAFAIHPAADSSVISSPPISRAASCASPSSRLPPHCRRISQF